ncbi:12815_t:CDS:2 [Gigaspora rosea]|nr:12815_t:CDS:2 [Gigaspora rosea]
MSSLDGLKEVKFMGSLFSKTFFSNATVESGASERLTILDISNNWADGVIGNAVNKRSIMNKFFILNNIMKGKNELKDGKLKWEIS